MGAGGDASCAARLGRGGGYAPRHVVEVVGEHNGSSDQGRRARCCVGALETYGRWT